MRRGTFLKSKDETNCSRDDKSNINHKNCENVRVENVLFNSKKTEKVVDKTLNDKEYKVKEDRSSQKYNDHNFAVDLQVKVGDITKKGQPI